MVAELATCVIALFALGAEWIHARRCRRIAILAFGPRQCPSLWARVAPLLRVCSLAALCWGLTTLLLADPKVHKGDIIEESDMRHVVLLLDVSPSMRLVDAGQTKSRSRMNRASDLMNKFFSRINLHQYRVSVVAFYTGSIPVVVDTRDMDVIDNILGELPMHFAFTSGKTDIIAGLKQVQQIAKPWNPNSAVLILLTDGDAVPATGMPKMPASIGEVLVIGVGDPHTGKFIDGHQSRQDSSTLRQIAVRLSGEYHNGNEAHITTATIRRLDQHGESSGLEKLTRREYALLAIALGSLIYASLPLALYFFGSSWRPGVPRLSSFGARHRGYWEEQRQETTGVLDADSIPNSQKKTAKLGSGP